MLVNFFSDPYLQFTPSSAHFRGSQFTRQLSVAIIGSARYLALEAALLLIQAFLDACILRCQYMAP